MPLTKDNQSDFSTVERRVDGIFQQILGDSPLVEPPTLEILNANGGSTSLLEISNMEGSLAPSRRVGWRLPLGDTYLDVADTNNDGQPTSVEAEAFKRDHPYDIHKDDQGIGIYTRPALDPALDDNRFYVRYYDAALAGKGEIKVKVQINNPCDPKSAYEESNQVILKESPHNPGEYISEPFLLVASKVDDKFKVNERKDNSKKDQTFLAEPGSQITVTFGKKNSEAISTQAQIPIKAVCDVQPIIYRDKPLVNGGKPLATQADVDRNMQNANEIHAPAGLKMKPTREALVLDPPAGVTFSDGLNLDELKLLAEDAHRANQQANQNSPVTHPAELKMILVGDQNFVDTPQTPKISDKDGISFVKGDPGFTPEMENTLFIKTHAQYVTPGHEIEHHILEDMETRLENVVQPFVPFNIDNQFNFPGYDDIGHVISDTHLMKEGMRFEGNVIDNAKHLTNDDKKNITSFIGVSPFLRPPTVEEFCPVQEQNRKQSQGKEAAVGVEPKEESERREKEEEEKKNRVKLKP